MSNTERDKIIIDLIANQQSALESLNKSLDIINSLIDQPGITDVSNPIGFKSYVSTEEEEIEDKAEKNLLEEIKEIHIRNKFQKYKS